MAGLKIVVPPASEPVTIDEVKAQLRIDADDESYDDVLNPLIPAAREWCEGYQNRAYITQTLELALDCWPCGNEIELPRPPLQSVTSLIYVDRDGNETTWPSTNYIVDDYLFVARLVRARGVCWPSVCLPAANGIKIRYIAGYPPGEPPDDESDGDPTANVPQRIKQAILLLVSHWFENGMCPPPPAVMSLLDLDRVVPV